MGREAASRKPIAERSGQFARAVDLYEARTLSVRRRKLTKVDPDDRFEVSSNDGVIEALPNPSGRGSTYHLTEAGRQLSEVVKGLGVWGQQWLEISPEHLDPDFLMWRIFKHLDPRWLPPPTQGRALRIP